MVEVCLVDLCCNDEGLPSPSVVGCPCCSVGALLVQRREEGVEQEPRLIEDTSHTFSAASRLL